MTILPFRQPTTQILRRERSSWLAIAAAAVTSGKTPADAITFADAFEQQLWDDMQACPIIDDKPPEAT